MFVCVRSPTHLHACPRRPGRSCRPRSPTSAIRSTSASGPSSTAASRSVASSVYRSSALPSFPSFPSSPSLQTNDQSSPPPFSRFPSLYSRVPQTPSSPPETPGRRLTPACPITVERAACRLFRVDKTPSTRITKCFVSKSETADFLNNFRIFVRPSGQYKSTCQEDG